MATIEYVRTDAYYDMYVPGPENYVAHGIVHHNTGLGKGREVGGIILDNWSRGRKRAVWISMSQKLEEDAKRDWKALGQNPSKISNLNKIRSGEPVTIEEGVLFSTYGTLIQKASKKAKDEGRDKSRVDQIVDWLGEDFEGVIAFDEAHKMGSALQLGTGRNRKPASATALAGVELQRRLPKARVVYVSATAATEVGNLAYADRLGLWGPKTAFPTKEAFVSEIEARGVGAMEWVARDMKALGSYLARGLSFDDGTPEGRVEYERLEHKLSKDQVDIYDKLSEAWTIVLNNIEEALGITDADRTARNQAMAQFWGSNQRFLNQVITAMQTPSAINRIKKNLDDGDVAVIQLTNTYEMAQERALAGREKDEDLEDFDITPRDMLLQMVERGFPVTQYEEYTDDDGNIRKRPARDSNGNIIKNRQAVEMRDRLLDELGSISVPDSPLDMIIDHFGHEQVAEVTGRKKRVVRMTQPDGKRKKVIDKRGKANQAEIDAFMAGKKRVLIFSEAGGTGASYHADRDSANQEKRHHYLLQAGWKADTAVQGLGRTHRSNQRQTPRYILVQTDLKGQKRFISTIARRLSQLGALTRGQRQAGSGGVFNAADNLESTEAREAASNFIRDLYHGEVEGITIDEFEKETGLRLRDAQGQLRMQLPPITQLLNRILSMPVAKQNQVFAEYEKRLEAKVEQATADGTLDQGMQNARHDRIRKAEDKAVYKHSSGAQTRYVRLRVANRTKPITFESVERKGLLSHVRNLRSGRVYAVERTTSTTTNATTGSVTRQYKMWHPAGYKYEAEDRLVPKYYEKLDEGPARELWDAEVANIPEMVERNEHILTGLLLPIWDRVPGNAQVKRFLTDEGETLLGRIVPEDNIRQVLRSLGAELSPLTITAQEAIDQLSTGEVQISLANGWNLRRAFVQRETRIEVSGPNFSHHPEMQDAGVFWERIASRTRYFIPMGDKSASILEQIAETRPIVDVQELSRGNATMGFPSPHGPTARPPDPSKRPYDPHSMPLRARPPKGYKRRTDATKVIDALAEVVRAFGGTAPIRVGRLSSRNAAGEWKIRAEVARILQANDIPTATHEVAHALEKAVFGYPKGGPWRKPTVDGKVQKELVSLGRKLYKKTVPNGGYKREGFAEFVRLYVSDNPQAEKSAPLFYEWFTTDFLPAHPDGKKAIEKARGLAEVFSDQGARNRGLEGIVDPASIAARIAQSKRTVNKILGIEAHIDMGHPFKLLADEAERLAGRQLAPRKNPYALLTALRMTHPARTKEMVETQMIDLAGNPVAAPLADIKGLVQGRQKDFTIYLWARRAVALWKDPKHSPRNPGLSLEDAATIIQDLETPAFQLAASKVYEWNEGVLNYAAQASPSFAQAVDRIRAMDPGYYLPLSREFAELDSLWKRGGGPKAVTGTIGNRLRGSGRRIKEPFQQMIANTEKIIRASHHRAVVDSMINLSRIEGMGNMIEEVPVEQLPVAHRTMMQLIDEMNRKLEGRGSISVSAQDPSLDLVGEVMTFFAPAQFPKGEDPIVPVWDQGRIRWFHVNPDLYYALGALDVYRLPEIAGFPILEWTLGKPAALLRAGTTGLRISFGLITNPSRDPQTMWVNSQSGGTGLRLFLSWAQAMGSALRNRVTGGRGAWLDTFIRLGGEMAQPLSQDIPHTKRTARRLFEGRVVRVIDPRNWLDSYREFIQFPESAPRIAELKEVAKQIGWEPGAPMSMDQSIQLLTAAKQVTTDFTAAGEFARVMNRMVPFYNASIQGPRANLRALKRNPVRFSARMLAISAATLALWWDHKDEDWYVNMPWREKFLYWHFPLGEHILLRLPRAFEVGVFAASLPEALIDAAYRENPRAIAEWFEVSKDVILPPITPVIPGEMIDQYRNRDDFWDTPIVPQGEELRPAEEQFNEYTTRASIAIGGLFKVSPRRIDHAIRNVAGPVAIDLLQLLGLGGEGVDREKELADAPIIGRLFQRGGKTGYRPQPIEDLYDNLELAKQRQHSKRNPESPADRQMRLMMEDATKAISALYYVRSQVPSVKERRQITTEALGIAKDVLAQTSAPSRTRDRFKNLRKRSLRRKERAKGAENQNLPASSP